MLLTWLNIANSVWFLFSIINFIFIWWIFLIFVYWFPLWIIWSQWMLVIWTRLTVSEFIEWIIILCFICNLFIWMIRFPSYIIPSIGCRICSGYISILIIGMGSTGRNIFFGKIDLMNLFFQTDDWSTNNFFVWTSVHEQLEALVKFELFNEFFTMLDCSITELLLVWIIP